MNIKEKALSLIGIVPMTNRDVIMDDLDRMDPERFATLLGLLSIEKVSADAQGTTDVSEWLNRPATLETILN